MPPDRMFALARERAGGRGARADPALAAGAPGGAQHERGTPARENNEAEEAAAARVQDIYRQVQRQVYVFLAATFIAIALTSLYLIRSNRRLFARLALLSNQRRELARQLDRHS